MPWYPESDGFVTRFWDERQWLIGLTSDYLVIVGKWIALNDIAGVSYWHRTTLHFPTATSLDNGPSYIYRGFTVTDFRGYNATLELNNKLFRDVPENEMAWRGLVDISRRTIEPRIAQGIFASIRAGKEYSVKDGYCFVTLSTSGFTGRTFRTTTYPWSDFYHVEVNPCQGVNVSTDHGKTRIWAQSGPKRKTRLVTGLDTRVPNAVVLASLMPMCAAAFATRVV